MKIFVSITLTTISVLLGSWASMDDTLYPYNDSTHPVLSATVDNDTLALYLFLSFFSISCAALSLLISWFTSKKNLNKVRRFVCLSMITVSLLALTIYGNRFIELWNLNASLENCTTTHCSVTQ